MGAPVKLGGRIAAEFRMSLRPFEISAPPPAPPSADKLAADLGLSSEERRAIKKFIFNAARLQRAAKGKTAIGLLSIGQGSPASLIFRCSPQRCSRCRGTTSEVIKSSARLSKVNSV